MTLSEHYLHTSRYYVARVINTLPQRVPCPACNRTRSLPHHHQASWLKTPKPSVVHCSLRIGYPSFQDHGSSTLPAGLRRPKVSGVAPMDLYGQRNVALLLRLLAHQLLGLLVPMPVLYSPVLASSILWGIACIFSSV